MKNRIVFGVALVASYVMPVCADVQVDFSRGKWDSSQWIVVKSPRLDYCRGFTQRDGWIENICPDVSPEEVFKKHNNLVYSGMVFRDKFKLGVCVSSKMGFDYRMAPLIVIAPELGKSADGKPEFREHWEIVLYDRGLNVWHHYMTEEGKPAWYKAASLLLNEKDYYRPNLRHDLKVKVSKNNKNAFVVGITGKIQAVFDYMVIDRNDPMISPAGKYGFSTNIDFSQIWSLKEYQESVMAEKKARDAWDEFERSIIVKIADDVIVGVRGKKVSIIIKKTFA